MEISVEYIASAIAGVIFPWIIERLKNTFSWMGSQAIIFLVGILGSLIALGVNYGLVHFGFSQPMPITELVLLGFGITETFSQLTYRTFVKE